MGDRCSPSQSAQAATPRIGARVTSCSKIQSREIGGGAGFMRLFWNCWRACNCTRLARGTRSAS